jgi:predicted nucleotidyltransferase
VPNEDFDALRETMKKAAAALRDADVPYLLGGGLACWARGGPETDHDLDFMVKPEDAERAQEALAAVGMRPENPPEDWLLKAYDSNDVLVDIIFRPASGPITDEVFARADEREVDAVRMRLMSLEDILVTKLLALSETHLDYESVLDIARPLREQIDWDEVRERASESPYARGFFALAEELDVIASSSAGRDGDAA